MIRPVPEVGLRLAHYDGGVEAIALPFVADLTSLSTDPDRQGAVFALEGWTHSKSVYRYDPEKHGVLDTGLQPARNGAIPNSTVEEIQVLSTEGAKIPLSIVRLTDRQLDGTMPVLLHAYGAFGVAQKPEFAPMELALLQHGSAYAVCHVRGGGEYGEEWHLAGQLAAKPHSWADIVACVQYLITERYTKALKLGLEGDHAGGIAIGRAMTERPDLFGVVVERDGISNTLRSEFSDSGAVEVPEFGSISTENGFNALLAMDVLSHVRQHTPYPAVLLSASMDDREVPAWQSAKLAARLQDANPAGRPVLLAIADHGDPDAATADMLAFFFWQVGLPEFQPVSSK